MNDDTSADREYSGRVFIVAVVILMLCILAGFVLVARAQANDDHVGHQTVAVEHLGSPWRS